MRIVQECAWRVQVLRPDQARQGDGHELSDPGKPDHTSGQQKQDREAAGERARWKRWRGVKRSPCARRTCPRQDDEEQEEQEEAFVVAGVAQVVVAERFGDGVVERGKAHAKGQRRREAVVRPPQPGCRKSDGHNQYQRRGIGAVGLIESVGAHAPP